MILCDTDVMIEAFKNNPRAVSDLRDLGTENIALSAVTVMELYYGALNKQELLSIKNHLNKLDILHIDRGISRTATNFIEQYAKSHALQIPDALIAATAVCAGIPLLTYNTSDFRYISGLRLYNNANS